MRLYTLLKGFRVFFCETQNQHDKKWFKKNPSKFYQKPIPRETHKVFVVVKALYYKKIH